MNYQRHHEEDVPSGEYSPSMTPIERAYCTPNARKRMLSFLLRLEKLVVGYLEEVDKTREEGGEVLEGKEEVEVQDEKAREQEEMAKIVKMALT